MHVQTLSPWENFFQFNGTTVKDFPLPKDVPLDRARLIDHLSQQLAAQDPAAAVNANGASIAAINAARTEYARLRSLMFAEQDELDWEVYRNYGLIDEELFLPAGQALGIALGERAFEIALAARSLRVKPRHPGSNGTGPPRSPRFPRTGRPSTGNWSRSGYKS